MSTQGRKERIGPEQSQQPQNRSGGHYPSLRFPTKVAIKPSLSRILTNCYKHSRIWSQDYIFCLQLYSSKSTSERIPKGIPADCQWPVVVRYRSQESKS